VPLVDAIAPEHLEIESEDAEHLAGASAMPVRFFWAPTHRSDRAIMSALEPRAATARSARFSSGLGVLDFMKRTSSSNAGPISCGHSAPPRSPWRSRRARRARSLGDDAPQPRYPPGARVPPKKSRLIAVTLDEASIGRSNPDVEHERKVAIYDLLEDNTFAPNDDEDGRLRCI